MHFHSKNKNLSFYYKYNIDIIENNVAKTLFFTNIPSDYLIDVKLEQGYKFTDSINRNTINEKFLRIKFYFNNGSIDSYYLNFKINNKYEYYLISKEKFSTDTNQNNNVGYCVEVYNKKINEEHMAYKNEINFMSSFFYSKNNWKCNEQINKKQK